MRLKKHALIKSNSNKNTSKHIHKIVLTKNNINNEPIIIVFQTNI